MIRIGEAPYLECSSRGFKLFSAFYARIKRRGNQTIEAIYQAAKVFEDGTTGLTIKEAKGRQAVNMEEVTQLYSQLWKEYMAENPQLEEVLFNATGLSDMFGQKGHVCQVIELWAIKQTIEKKPEWL